VVIFPAGMTERPFCFTLSTDRMALRIFQKRLDL
jgi:hypothetical protein